MGWVGGESGADISGCVSIVRDGRDSLSLSFYYYARFCQRYFHLLSGSSSQNYMLKTLLYFAINQDSKTF